MTPFFATCFSFIHVLVFFFLFFLFVILVILATFWLFVLLMFSDSIHVLIWARYQ